MTTRRGGRRWRRLRAAILATSDICGICGQPGADSVDHIVPLAAGGAEYDPTNCRPVHGSPCNYSRNARGLASANPAIRSREW